MRISILRISVFRSYSTREAFGLEGLDLLLGGGGLPEGGSVLLEDSSGPSLLLEFSLEFSLEFRRGSLILEFSGGMPFLESGMVLGFRRALPRKAQQYCWGRHSNSRFLYSPHKTTCSLHAKSLCDVFRGE